MIWGAMAVSAISAYMQYQQMQNAQRQADRAYASQQGAMDQQTALGREQLAFSREQAATANAAADRAYQLQTQQFAFQQQQYDEWQRVYGPIQQSLANFYGNLSTEEIAASGLESVRQTYAKADLDIQRNMAARNIDSAAAESIRSSMALQKAETEAGIREQAKYTKADMQNRFVQQSAQNPYGSGLANAYGNLASAEMMRAQNAMNVGGMVGGAYGAQSNIYGQQAGIYGSQAANYGNMAMAGGQGVGQALGGAASAYMYYEGRQNQSRPRPEDAAGYSQYGPYANDYSYPRS